MSVSCVVELAGEEAERVPADLLVAPCFESERPLVGAAGRVDWRLCGYLSSLLEREIIAGRSGEVVLLPSAGRLRAPRTLLVGLGPRKAFRASALRDAVMRAVQRAADLRAGVVALAVPGEADSGLGSSALAGALVAGLVGALRAQPFPLRARLVTHQDQEHALRRGLVEAAARVSDPAVVLRIADPPNTGGPQAPAPRGAQSQGAAPIRRTDVAR